MLCAPALLSAQGTADAKGSAPARKLRVPYTLDSVPNGLTLIVHEDHSTPIVTTDVWFHVGSGDEKPGRTGFAHLFEHLMFMGSEHAENPQFDRLLEAAGANNNGSTTEDRTNYYESGPSTTGSFQARATRTQALALAKRSARRRAGTGWESD